MGWRTWPEYMLLFSSLPIAGSIPSSIAQTLRASSSIKILQGNDDGCKLFSLFHLESITSHFLVHYSRIDGGAFTFVSFHLSFAFQGAECNIRTLYKVLKQRGHQVSLSI
jgi:hypothetical protein